MNYKRATGAPRVLVRMPNWLGDCIMALPALRYLRESFSRTEIIVACRRSLSGFMTGQMGVDRVVLAPESGIARLAPSLLLGASGLSLARMPGGIDLGVLYTNSMSTAAWVWRMGVRNRIGYNLDRRWFFLTNPIRCDQRIYALHFIDYYLELSKRTVDLAASWLEPRFIPRNVRVTEDFLYPQLAVDSRSRNRASSLVAVADVEGHYAVFAPVSAYGAVKDWPVEYYRNLAVSIIERFDLDVVLTGAASQRMECTAIAGDNARIHNLAGQTDLGSFLGVIEKADLFVGGDSGGAHAAAALDIPTLVIFGITNPARTSPAGRKVTLLGRGCRQEVKLSTPEARARAAEALRSITVEDAMQAIEYLMDFE